MTRAFLSLGSNMGDRRRFLVEAVESLGSSVVAVSPVYETDPVGGPDQGGFLNLVVELDTDRSARELLAVCHRLESGAQRTRTVRWGPRTLDVDIIWMDGVEVSEPDLQVPHPRWQQRRFVLAPLRDLAPELVDQVAYDQAAGVVRRVGALAEDSPGPSADVDQDGRGDGRSDDDDDLFGGAAFADEPPDGCQ